MSMLTSWTRRPHGLLCATLTMLILAGCGAAPQTPGGQAAPTAYPAPQGQPTAYPAPQGDTDPTAYPAPLGEGAATEPAATTVAAPTSPPMEVTVPPLPTTSVALPTPGQGGVSGEVPEEKIALAVADLAQRTGVDPARVTVVSAVAVEWSDGSLGCPQPDMAYLQVITPGYKLVLAAGGQEYNYHAATDGEFFLCENRAP